MTQAAGLKLVERSRLMALLTRAPRVTLIRAPAGYGKSLLLDQWTAHCSASGTQICRLDLTSGDREPAAFTEKLFRMLGQPAPRELTASTIADALPQGTHLIIDDADWLREASETRALLMEMVKLADDHHFVFSSRAELHLPLARYRAGGALLELDAAEMRFDAAECEAMIAANAEHTLSRRQVEALEKSLEGWPCGYGLQFQSRRQCESTELTHTVVSGSWKILADYFDQEVCSALPPQLQKFLAAVSVLDQLSPSLCERLVDHAECGRLLEQAYSLGVHMSPQDPEHRSFRLLPVFATFLHSRLSTQELDQLRLRACEVLESCRDFRGACVQALARGDQERAADLLERQYQADFAARDERRHIELSRAIDPAVRDRHPFILLGMTQTLIFSFQFEQARTLLDRARRLVTERIEHGANGKAGDQVLQMLLLHREMLLALGQHEMVTAQSYCDQLMQNMSVIPPMQRVMILNSLMQAQLELYNFREAERLYLQARKELPSLESWVSSVPLETFYARFLFQTGRTSEAVGLLEQTLSRLEQEMGARPLLGSIVGIALAEMRLERGELEEASRLMTDYSGSSEHFGLVSMTITGRITWARLLIMAGQTDEGLRALEHPPLVAGELYERVTRALTVERINWLLHLGREQHAKYACNLVGLSLASIPEPGQRAATREESFAIAWIQLARAHNRLDSALHLARKWLRYTESVGAVRSASRWNVLISVLCTLMGERTQAQRSLRRAISVAAPNQYRQMFINELNVIGDLLRVCVQADSGDPESEFVNSILRNRSGTPEETPAQDGPLQAGSLTIKENEVVTLLARGMSNREIGAVMGMTEGTVKWYLHRIYDKLGVRRRSQVVAQVARLRTPPQCAVSPPSTTSA